MTVTSTSEDAIVNALRDAILSRKLAPGTRLREVRLGKILGASRGEVRKALNRLTHEGLVEHQLNRGAAVAQPSAQEAKELFAARKCIEVAVARIAAQNMTPSGLKRLQEHLSREQKAREHGDMAQIVALSGEFHILIAEIAGNAPLKRYLEDLVARESLIIQLFGIRAHDNCSRDEHAEIVAALQTRDDELISNMVEEHIEGIAAGLDLNLRPAETLSLEEILLGE
ncbi:GntR family transcriptional regulator [uncultured Roseibium sp.]|uniref:GntR family transcriptional regulator n=1 Tax=uncultured Roseibium sp. TaxID=1936171 RepID=UPI00262D985B|nr:GntR family transcriptional regulator [uncultured Roseibium sp.]